MSSLKKSCARTAVLLTAFALAPSARPATLISMADVRGSLTAQGVIGPDASIAPLPAVEQKTFAVRITVSGVQILTRDSARLRLRCRDAGECLPFYAVVSWPSEEQMRSGIHAFTSAQPQAVAAKPAVMMRAGKDAILIVRGAHSEMRIPVISLQNGVMGNLIRVTSHDHKQIYRAEVVNEGVLLMRNP